MRGCNSNYARQVQMQNISVLVCTYEGLQLKPQTTSSDAKRYEFRSSKLEHSQYSKSVRISS